jgi:hypothetical protein
MKDSVFKELDYEEKQKCISAIIKMEYEILKAIFEGHSPNVDDCFKNYRFELDRLRTVLFDDNYILFCEKNDSHPLGDVYYSYLSENIKNDTIAE